MKYLGILVLIASALMFSAPLWAEKAATEQDNGWISLEGTVVAKDATGFELDYGQGTVQVSMENWKWDRSVHPLTIGSEVRVIGRSASTDTGTTHLKAESVYMKKFNTYLYAREGDEVFQPAIIDDRVFQLQGRITSIQGREFTMRVGLEKVAVDTSAMPYNPLDDKGYQQLEVGETVQVTGRLTTELFKEGGGIKARTVTTLRREEG